MLNNKIVKLTFANNFINETRIQILFHKFFHGQIYFGNNWITVCVELTSISVRMHFIGTSNTNKGLHLHWKICALIEVVAFYKCRIAVLRMHFIFNQYQEHILWEWCFHCCKVLPIHVFPAFILLFSTIHFRFFEILYANLFKFRILNITWICKFLFLVMIYMKLHNLVVLF